jgi:hypothetical protein
MSKFYLLRQGICVKQCQNLTYLGNVCIKQCQNLTYKGNVYVLNNVKI